MQLLAGFFHFRIKGCSMDCEQTESDNLADLYLMGKLDSFKKAQFEIHFLSCQKCSDLVFETQVFCEALRAATAQSEPAYSKATATRPATLWLKTVLAAAAAVVIALLLSAVLLFDNFRLRQQLGQEQVFTAQLPQPEPQPEQNSNASAQQNHGSEQGSPPDRRSNSFPPSPQINTPIVALSAIRGMPANNPETNEISISASQWFVISNELENKRLEDYSATILTSDRRTLWKSGDLRPDRHDAITIGCAPGFLRPGNYLLILEGQPKQGSLSAVGTYPFRVVKKIK
jgi:hypothetical protein